MEELIRKMIRDLLEQIDEKKPEAGRFKSCILTSRILIRECV